MHSIPSVSFHIMSHIDIALTMADWGRQKEKKRGYVVIMC